MESNTGKKRLWNRDFIFACCANFCMFFAFYMLLPILALYLSERFEASRSVIGLVLASYTIMALVFRPFAGYMVDSFSRKPLLLFCYTAYIACFGGYLLAGALAVLAVFRIVHGMSLGMVTVSINTVAIDIMPSSRRGAGIGYFGVMSNIAMAIGPMTGLVMLGNLHNFQAVFATSLISGVIGLFCASMIHDRHKPVQPPDKTLSFDRFLLRKGIPNALAMILMSFNYGALSTYVATYGRVEAGIPSSGGKFFVFLAAGLIVSRVVTARLIDKGRLTGISIAGIMLAIASFLTFIFIHIPLVFYLSGLGIGVGYGMLAPTFQTMLINLAPSNRRGTANATYLASWDLGIGLGVLFGGVIAEHYNYAAAYLAGVCLMALGGLIFIFYAAPYYNRHRLR